MLFSEIVFSRSSISTRPEGPHRSLVVTKHQERHHKVEDIRTPGYKSKMTPDQEGSISVKMENSISPQNKGSESMLFSSQTKKASQLETSPLQQNLRNQDLVTSSSRKKEDSTLPVRKYAWENSETPGRRATSRTDEKPRPKEPSRNENPLKSPMTIPDRTQRMADTVISTTTTEKPAAEDAGKSSSPTDGEGVMEVEMLKGSIGLGFCIEGGKGSPRGDLPIKVKRLFKGEHHEVFDKSSCDTYCIISVFGVLLLFNLRVVCLMCLTLSFLVTYEIQIDEKDS